MNARMHVFGITLSAVMVGASASAQAAGYMGIDLVQIDTELTIVGLATETYNTSHLRFKAGAEVAPWLALEAQLITAGDDTTLNESGDAYRHDTGTILGLFAKPQVALGAVDLYGLVGLATADATNDCSPSCPPPWEATLNGPAYGLGAQFWVNRNFRLSLDYMVYHDGSVTYDDGFGSAFRADNHTSGVSIGANFRF